MDEKIGKAAADGSLLSQLTVEQVEDLIWEELNRNPRFVVDVSEYLVNGKSIGENNGGKSFRNYPLITAFFETEFKNDHWKFFHKSKSSYSQTKILYACDVYDIFRYCFPLVDGSSAKVVENIVPASFEMIIDQHLAWQWFFNQTDVILLDQYNAEFRGQQQKMEKMTSSKGVDEFQEILRQIDIRGKDVSDFSEVHNIYKFLESFGERLPFYLGLVFGFAEDGNTKLAELVKSRLLTNDRQIISKGYSFQLTERFSENQAGIDSDAFYLRRRHDVIRNLTNEYVNPETETSKLTQDKFNDLLVRRLLNLDTDCSALDRLLNINRSLQLPVSEDVNTRYILLFVSSTDRFENQFSHHEVYKEKRPLDIFGRKVNILRNVKQLYLQLLINSNVEQTFAERFNTYLSYWQVLKARDSYRNYSSTFDDLNQFKDLIKQLRDTYTNIQLFEHYRNFYSRFSNSILAFREKLRETDLENVLNEFDSLSINFEKVKKQLDVSNVLLRKLYINYTFQERINFAIPELKEGKIGVSYGMIDYVVGNDHHMPTVLSVRNFDYQPILDKIIQVILKPVYGQQFSIEFGDFLEKTIRRSILNRRDNLGLYDLVNSLDDNIVKYLLFFILPSPVDLDDTPESELLWVITGDIKQIREYAIPNATKEERIHFQQTLQNLRYIKGWALRRSGRYQESLQIMSAANKTDLDEFEGKDPRFHHGAALAHYCIFRKDRDNSGNGNIELLKKSINAAEKSFVSYCSSLKNGPTDLDHHNAENKAFIALVNTLINLKVLMVNYVFENSGHKFLDASSLIECRYRMDKFIKSKLQDIGISIKDYPEYLHTEAFLEYFEAWRAYLGGELTFCLEKLNNSFSALKDYQKLSQIRDFGNQWRENQSQRFYIDLAERIESLRLKCSEL